MAAMGRATPGGKGIGVGRIAGAGAHFGGFGQALEARRYRTLNGHAAGFRHMALRRDQGRGKDKGEAPQSPAWLTAGHDPLH
jgi:hypothetical protein